MLEAKRAANTAARKRYTVGLEKLASSASQVAGMQAELVAMQPQLVATVAEVEELMTRIAHEKKVRCHEQCCTVLLVAQEQWHRSGMDINERITGQICVVFNMLTTVCRVVLRCAALRCVRTECC